MLLRRTLLSLMVLRSAASLAESPPATPPNLCSAHQTVIFSCGVGEKAVSLCASGPASRDGLILEYKFGAAGKTPELSYPTDARPASKAFEFTVTGGGNGPTWVVSFDNKYASYDVMSALQGDSLPEYGFFGLGVTVKEEQTQLRSCNPGPLIMNMKNLNDLGFFPEYVFPKHDNVKPPFQVINKTIKHGDKWTSKMEYPIVGDVGIDSRIGQFIHDCYEGDDGDAGNCVQSVTADLILGKYLVLTFDHFTYEEGAPHGDEEVERSTYVKGGNGWAPIAPNGLIAQNDHCQKRYASLLNRRIRPEMGLKWANEDAPEFDDLFKSAQQVLIVDGVIFEFNQYELGPRVSPEGIFVDFKTLGDCFAPQVLARDSS